MKTDGSVLIDTKIDDSGVIKGFHRLADGMDSVADHAQSMGRDIASAFAGTNVASAVDSIRAEIQSLEGQMESVTAERKVALAEGDDKGVASLERRMTSLYDRLEKARQRLAREVEKEASRQARAEEKAAERSIKAAEKEAKEKARLAQKQADIAMRPVKRFKSRISEIVTGALFFNIVSAGIREMTQYFGEALKTNDQYTNSVAKLKGALLTAFQPIYEYVVPAIIYMIDFMTAAIEVVGQFFATLSGKDYSQMQKNAEAMYNEAKGIKAVGDSAEKAKKQLMGFDEINRLSDPKTETVGTGKTDNASADAIAPEFEEFDISKYEEKIHKLIALVSTSLLAIGAILTFSGANIPLGIALMAAGAVGLAAEVALNWDSVKQALDGPIGDVIALVSGSLLALGAILAFSGANIPLGIGLMSIGAAGLATAIAAKWDTIKKALQGPIGGIVSFVSASLLALGAILAFSGANIPLGIGLIVAGAAGLATTVAVNWDTIKNTLRGPVGDVVSFVSGALLALGAVLAFSGAGLPLGIGLMAAGAVGLGTTAALNWDTVKNKIEATIASIVAILSGASLVLGVLLCMSGAGIGLGLPLIAAGLAGSFAAWSLNDNPITRFVRDLANGIIKMINRVASSINDLFHIRFDGLRIGGQVIIPDFSARLIQIPPIPYLAQGAVIPPNAPFMAVLGDQKHGTNIEAPLSTIQEALRAELGGNGLLSTLQEQNKLLRQILANSGVYLDGERISKTVTNYQRRSARAGGY